MKTLKQYRLDAGLSVKDVAQQMGVSARVVYSWEAGSRGLGVSSLVQLLTLYRVDPPMSTLTSLVPALLNKQKTLHP